MGSQPVDAGAEGSIGFDDGPATIFDQADIPRVRPFKRPLHHSLMLAARGRTSVKIFALCASSIGTIGRQLNRVVASDAWKLVAIPSADLGGAGL